jgi:hypothetical protein
LLAFGFGMSLVVIALYLIQFVVLPPFHRLYNRVQYGAYPVYHLSADLGRGGKSDVFSFGVQGSAVVIIVTGDKTEVCQVSLPGVNASSVVLVSVLDVNGDGRQDILLHVDGTDTSAVLFGTGKSFRDRP